MISTMDTGEICSVREHSHRRNRAGECPAVRSDRPFPHDCPQLDSGITVCLRPPPGRAPRKTVRAMEKVLTYMLQNLHQPVQMPVLGALAGVSMSHFYYLFKLATGHTPNNFLIHARMRRAGGLFRVTKLSVKEVAAVLGYDDPFYFSRMFKAVSGFSPRQYRLLRAHLEGHEKTAALAAFESDTFGPLLLFPPQSQSDHPDISLAKTRNPPPNHPVR